MKLPALCALCLILQVAPSALAQCPSAWQPGIGIPGINDSVYALATTASGDVIAAGTFTTAGITPANRIARWNGTTWSALGSGLNGAVNAITVMPTGEIIAAGDFTAAGATPVSRIARWNGTTWSALGSGFNSSVYALAVLPNGSGGNDLIAGGLFSTAGGIPASCIARWNGAAWSPLGPGLNSTVLALTVMPNGSGGYSLFAGGSFWAAGPTPASCVARWNGTTWSALGAGTNQQVLALAALPNASGSNDLIAGGFFTAAGGQSASYIARWNGAAWSPLGTGVSYIVTSLATVPNPFGPSSIIAGGPYSSAGSIAVWGAGRWNGTAWSSLGGYTDQRINALTLRPDGAGGGDLYLAGDFEYAGAGEPFAPTAANRIAKFRFGAAGPSITAHPQPASACAASTATFTVAALGRAPITYQWRKGTNNINTTTNPSAATATLTLSNISPADIANYSCIIATPCGTIISNAAPLTITTCVTFCLADVASDSADDTRNPNNSVGPEDIEAFVNAFISDNSAVADVASDSADTTYNPSGSVGPEDLEAFVNSFIAGC